MMKGPKPGRYAPNSTPEDRMRFMELHRNLVEELIPRLPRASAAVGAVISKCAIKYGKDKAIAFADAVKNCKFCGPNDPALLFWQYLLRSKNKPAVEVYKITVTAARAYCENRTLTSLRPAETDIFEWEKGNVS